MQGSRASDVPASSGGTRSHAPHERAGAWTGSLHTTAEPDGGPGSAPPAVSTEAEFVREGFTDRHAFDELVRAAEGPSRRNQYRGEGSPPSLGGQDLSP